MAKKVYNTAASVHQRLMNIAKESARPFNVLLQHYANERFLYRLSKSAHAESFILKGAMMLSVWSGPRSRSTMDIDFLATIDNATNVIVAAMEDACQLEVEPDGMSFNSTTVTADRIAADTDLEGVRVRVRGNLGTARIIVQIDIGFGDVVTPGPSRITLPSILDFQAPELDGYSMESVIAEKYEAMVKLGILNSRMKDFYDIWMLSRSFDFEGKMLAEAIEKTFENRNTTITVNPEVFAPSFVADKSKVIQWRAFIRKARLTDAPEDFRVVMAGVKEFLESPVISLGSRRPFRRSWIASGPWR